jgi:ADP-heptose:LPS heptosyltransferase
MEKVLIVSSTGMGDCLWGTPAIRAIKKTFPDAEVDLVVNSNWQPLFECNPYLHKIFEYREQWYRQPLLGLQLFGRHYDAIFIFHANRNFKRMLPWLRLIPVWCHQNLDWVAESHRIKLDIPIHGIQRRLSMLEKHGVKPDGGQMEIFFDHATMNQSQRVLQAHNFISGKYVYLNLGASVERKRWMVERFSELARRILDTTSWNIVLGGGGEEDKKRAFTIMKQLNSTRVITDCSQPLRVSAAYISEAGLMVTSDTGPMHIGFAVKTPIVALFGTMSSTLSGPYVIPDHLCKVITIDPDEQNYDEETNPGELHFRSITVDKVWEQVEKMIQANSNP